MKYKIVRNDRIICFLRYPVPGQTKTRLIPSLGKTGAAALHRLLAERTLETVKSYAGANGSDVGICFEGGDETKIRRWLGYGTHMNSQPPGDLGNRMYCAFLNAFERGCRRVVLVGTDVPDLEIEHLEVAFKALTDHDLVLGPSTDGGYWLIGLRRIADIFQGINWGGRDVLRDTVALAERKAMKVFKLPPLMDIDTVDDLNKWLPESGDRKPFVSVVIPTLDEGPNLGRAIVSAIDEESEVIVIDGGSTDNTIDVAIKSSARVEISRRGRARQMNRGAELAKGENLLFLHADTVLPDNYLGYIFDSLIEGNTVAGAFMFKTDLEKSSMRVIEFMANIRSKYLKLPYGDQGFFVRKNIFKEVGGFPEVPVGEDLLLIRRLSKRGLIRIAPVPVLTSGRRWRNAGIFKTTLINQIILSGYLVGIPPSTLANIYCYPVKNKPVKKK